MRLSIVDRSGQLDGPLREYAERRLRFALSRFDSRVERVKMVLSDENGPRGGLDKACRVSVNLRGLGNMVVTSQDAELPACIARAADRIGRRVARAVELDQRFERTRH